MLPDNKEYQLIYAKQLLEKTHYDYFIFGHRHIPIELKLNESATFINLGDWITYNTYAQFDGQQLFLKKY
jgi:UDP-2,3-diacylglucosamine hydrolase